MGEYRWVLALRDSWNQLPRIARAGPGRGSFAAQGGVGVGVTAQQLQLVPASWTQHPRFSLAAKAMKYIKTSVQQDGGIYSPGGMLANYETCLAIMCLTEANADRHYSRILEMREAYVRTHQWDESQRKERDDLAYGGAGYGKRKRPDLSNMMFLDRRPEGVAPWAKRSRHLRAGRSGHSEGVGVCLTLPKPRERAQHHAVCRQESRRRFLLHLCRRWWHAAGVTATGGLRATLR